MRRMWWVVTVVAAVVLVGTYVTWTAARVDRLHARTAAAFAALDAQLVRRAAGAATLGETADLPALTWAARLALDALPGERETAENDLTRELRTVVGTVVGTVAGTVDDPLGAELVAVSRRVALARQVHNDVVRDALAVRRRRPVRLLRLARRLDDEHPSSARKHSSR